MYSTSDDNAVANDNASASAAPVVNDTTKIWLAALRNATENGTLRNVTEDEAAFVEGITQNDTAIGNSGSYLDKGTNTTNSD